MSELAEGVASEEWREGHLAGSDDAVAWLDYRDAARTRDAYVLSKGAPSKTRNPHPQGTYEYSEWGNGYEHGWHESVDRYRRLP